MSLAHRYEDVRLLIIFGISQRGVLFSMWGMQDVDRIIIFDYNVAKRNRRLYQSALTVDYDILLHAQR